MTKSTINKINKNMNHIKQLYKHSLPLLTDLYQLTMAYGYWKSGRHEQEAIFSLFFRKPPFNGAITITAGLNTALEYLEDLQFTQEDLNYLATLKGADDKILFEKGFLDYLGNLHFDIDLDGIPEGTIVFPNEPLLRVQGSLLQCQLLETALLNIVNFQTLIATKSARVCQATQGEPVLEFGLRRAQGVDGAITASRAAYIGGCAATSNVLAGKIYGIPVKGTHAHSWIMSFDDEAQAFENYAQAMPNNCVFLVDTYNTINGVKLAIQTGKRLRKRGHEMVGIRLDSGDLAMLSKRARAMLDAAGFENAAIVASNDLDEHLICELKAEGAKINVWGVGTKLVTAYDQPALGGVYKLAAIRENADSEWEYRLKISEQVIKISNPGAIQVRRFSNDKGIFIGDMLFEHSHSPIEPPTFVPDDFQRELPANTMYEDLLIPLLRKGKSVTTQPTLNDIRRHLKNQWAHCPLAIKGFHAVNTYPIGLEIQLYKLKQKLISQSRSCCKKD